ncbi:lysylphosphatidylglycerol synthase transmembrane domain-containing protein [Algoriphagus halophytocola]|uniref:Flippase-like domain-containing protein n=1 Tax=Algoriphagus halophytocola TaxID=2991499 RepID=A0ABY6MDX0_9BACT|nr:MULTISPECIES: lysylphosphatidylglycerol synthase transmembrane domain-containing protein [unclassified Algoriphagus]UZD21962.1 flippase-like domain-containing protein [Algoriphagus sp. TR-M5]WBL43213.1 lysylphosphatidylglycerol synthase transmembrane domain-containing protein [Algoriphagus sp. TR-M9]
MKLVLTGLALFLVFRKIDTDQLWQITKTIHWLWLLPAVLTFVLSKVFTAFRLNLYFKNTQLYISEKLNLKLYLIGMFYNLFLPGGIGGDGYKVYLLNKHFQTPVKSLVQAALLDRLGGLVAIVFLLLAMVLPVDLSLPFVSDVPWELLIVGAALLVFPVFWLVQKLMFKVFLPSFWKANAWSMAGQLAQLICAYFILKSLGVAENFLAYQLVFLLSSIVAVLPLTIGGVGARELVFVYAHTYAGIDESIAVAFSLIFFLITALVSLAGAMISINFDQNS